MSRVWQIIFAARATAFLKHGFVQPFDFVYALGMCERKTKAISGMGKKQLYMGTVGSQSAFENEGFLQHFCPHKSAKRKKLDLVYYDSSKLHGAMRPMPAASCINGYFCSGCNGFFLSCLFRQKGTQKTFLFKGLCHCTVFHQQHNPCCCLLLTPCVAQACASVKTRRLLRLYMLCCCTPCNKNELS
jgi:hypothetical protein